MRTTELYINGEKLDLEQSLPMVMTWDLESSSNPTTIKNSYSEIVKVPGTENNSRIFGNANILSSTILDFDPTQKARFRLMQNSQLIEAGSAWLVGITTKGTDVTFDLQLAGEVEDFFQKLSINEDGTKKTMRDVFFGLTNSQGGTMDIKDEFSCFVNKELVNESYLGGGFGPLYFIPSYNGVDPNFDAKHCIVSNDTFNRNIPIIAQDGFTLVQSLGLGTFERAYDEWEMRDLRSYLQRPGIRVNDTITAICSVANSGYTINLDPTFFNNDNPYWRSTHFALGMPDYKRGGEADWWKKSTLPSYQNYSAVAFGNGLYIGVARNTNIGILSHDGITWATTTLPAVYNWLDIIFGDGKFVALSSTGQAAVTTDGISWTLHNIPDSGYTSLAYGGGLYIAVAGVTNVGAYSHDGITWATTTLPYVYNWIDIIFGDGKFVALSSTGQAAVTTDGINWTLHNMPSTSYTSLAYGNGLYIAVTTTTVAVYSFDAITWVQTTLPSATAAKKITFGNGLFIYVGYDAKGYSTIDGITWKVFDMPIYETYSCIVYGGGLFVSLASNSTLSSYFIGRQLNKSNLFPTDYTPLEYLLSFTKMFGLHFVKDEGIDKSYTIMTPNTFFGGSETIDWDERIDLNRGLEQKPTVMDSRFYTMNAKEVSSQLLDDYKKEKNYPYGEKRIDTDFRVGSESKELVNNNILDNVVTLLDTGKYYNVYTSQIVEPYNAINSIVATDGYKYLLYKNFGLPTQETIEIVVPAYSLIDPTLTMPFTDNGPLYTDRCAKSCFFTQETESRIINDIQQTILFDNGWGNSGITNDSLVYFITDDTKEMYALNQNAPCYWCLSNADAHQIGIGRVDLPRYTRYYTGRAFNTTDIVHSLDYGKPDSVNFPVTSYPDSATLFEFWRKLYADQMDKNTKHIKVWANVEGLRTGERMLRLFHYFRNSWWVMMRLEIDLANENLALIEFIQVQDIDNYKNMFPTFE